MLKRLLGVFVLTAFVFTLTGCATVRKQRDEIQGLRNQVSAMESQLQAKDQEIGSLKAALDKVEQEKTTEITVEKGKKAKKIIPEVKSRPHGKQIQVALKNAGYYSGKIDGKIGKQTKDAIKSFQTANNLKADGKMGKETWKLLSENLYKKVK